MAGHGLPSWRCNPIIEAREYRGTLLCVRRALFGADEECITSLGAWQQMVTEARWVGRALYDAEDIALQHTGGA